MSTTDEPAAEDTSEDRDEVETTAGEPESTIIEDPAPGPPPPNRLAIAGIAAVYLTVFGLVVGLGWQLWQQHRVAAAGEAGQRAAVDYAQVLTSIDSNKVDDDFAAVLNGATGDFKDTYTKASVELRQLLIDNKASARGKVVDSAVQSETADKVVVLVMVDQAITNTARPDPRVDRSRMKMTMQKVDGRWLASKVELP